jgi:hypothetical protein
MFIQRTKQEYMTRSKPVDVLRRPTSLSVLPFVDTPGIAAMRFTSVSEDQRQEYSIVFGNLWRLIIEVDPKMIMYAVLLQEDLVRRLIAMVRSPNMLQPYLFLTYNPGFYLPTTAIVALFQSTEVPPGTPSSEDDDRPSPGMHCPIQPSLGCYEWR